MQDPWQTRASAFHPYLADGIDALPESLRRAAKASLPPGSTALKALVVPQEYRSEGEGEPRLVPEQALIFTESGVLHVKATPAGEIPQPASYVEPHTILYMRSSHLLLHGRVEVVYARQSGVDKLDVTFNAVGWPLMNTEWRVFVQDVICAPHGPTNEEGAERARAVVLPESVPQKFADGLGRYALYTSEHLLGTVFQPGIWTQSLFAFDEQVTPNTLLALTDCSMLVLEEERALVRESDQPGLIITRIPRSAIGGASSTEEGSWHELRISLERCGAMATLRMFLELDKADAWRKLWEAAD